MGVVRPFVGRVHPDRHPVHFVATVAPGAVAAWDPDRDPERFADGEGHQIVELFARLRDRGLPVTIGPRPPRGALLVVSADHLVSWRGPARRRARAQVARSVLAGSRLVVVLGDHPHPERLPGFVGTRVAPTPSAARSDPDAVWLPLLPQRALVPRDPARRGTLRRLAIKAFPGNVPPAYRDPDLARRLGALGVDLRIDDTPTAWPDFSTVDLVACVGHPQPEWDTDPRLDRKPPTKLINAWAAGCVPLIAPQTGYLDLARPGIDAVLVRSPDDVCREVARLADDPAALAALETASTARGAAFTTDAVTDRWVGFCWAPDRPVVDRIGAARDLVAVVGDAGRDRLRRLRAGRAAR